MKQKDCRVYFLRANTPMKSLKAGGLYCIAFDFAPESKQKMIGIGTDNPDVARAIACYFMQMADAIEGRA